MRYLFILSVQINTITDNVCNSQAKLKCLKLTSDFTKMYERI